MEVIEAWPYFEGACITCGDRHTRVHAGSAFGERVCETCQEWISHEYTCAICKKQMLDKNYEKHLEKHSKEELISHLDYLRDMEGYY